MENLMSLLDTTDLQRIKNYLIMDQDAVLRLVRKPVNALTLDELKQISAALNRTSFSYPSDVKVLIDKISDAGGW